MDQKKIAIIGKDSYIGQHMKARFEANGDYAVDEIDARDDSWKDTDFSVYIAVIHVAGIVHRPDVTDWNLYKTVNTDLPVQVATLAKSAGVKQFVFFSTMGVYGVEKRLSKNVIDATTAENPKSMYGQSKYDAELLLQELQDGDFTVSVVRPPNVYGKGCRGGYIPGFTSIVRRLPAIPFAFNDIKQSMIYIDNLSEVVYALVASQMAGTFMPQDDAPVSAVELMEAIAAGLGINRPKSRLLGFFARLFAWTPLAVKAFGGIEYSSDLSEIPGINYRVVSVKEGISRSVRP